MTSQDIRLLAHAGGVAVALFLAFAFRAAVDGRFAFSLVVIGLGALQALPLGAACVIVAAAAFGLYDSSTAVSPVNALATAALGVALQQPFAAVTGGTPLPVVMIPLEVVLVAVALTLGERVSSRPRTGLSASSADR